MCTETTVVQEDPSGRDPIAASSPSAAARLAFLHHEGRPLFRCDWLRTVMLHYAVSPEILQPLVPLTLDTHEGQAYVSVVAFSMRRPRPERCWPLGATLMRLFAAHDFLNVRTYVRASVGGENSTGIYFMAEWLPNRLSRMLGPPVYGLPYRLGAVSYKHQPEAGLLTGSVKAAAGGESFRYRAEMLGPSYAPSRPGSLDAFLLERYVAFTVRRGVRRFFRISHEPWPQTAIQAVIEDDALLHLTGRWLHAARLVAAHYSPGVSDVWIGRPRRLTSKTEDRP